MADLAPLEVIRRDTATGALEVHRLDRGQVLLGTRPKPRPATLQAVDDGWVLVNEDRTVYLRLTPEDHLVWTLVDGHNTVTEIATAWFFKFGAVRVGQVGAFIQTLRRGGFVEVEPAGFLRRRAPHVSWLHREWRWTGMHSLAARVWRVLAPVAGWPALVGVLAVVALGGAAGLPVLSVATGDTALFASLFIASLLAHVIGHELAHAVAIVGFGRRVLGLRVGLGGVSVDSTDMFLGSRAAHATVALAGPAFNLVLVALASIVARALPLEAALPARALADAGLVVLALTGWPFLLDNDAAHALADLTGIPNLRRASWRAWRAGAPGAAHVVYALGCVVTVVAAVGWLGWG